MVDLLEALDGAGAEMPQTLNPVRTSANASLLLFFTRNALSARLHYVADPAVRGNVPCPGAGCPLCHCSQAPDDVFLLPVVNLGARAVEVLRIANRRGPGTLLAQIHPHIRGEGLADKLFRIQRFDSKFVVEVQPLGPDADRCVGLVKGFETARQGGLSLLSAFPEFTAAELAEVPQVRQMLDAVGGWTAPEPKDVAGS